MPPPPLNEQEQEIIDQLRSALDSYFHRAGHGAKARVARELGIDPSLLGKAFRSGYIRFGLLIQVLGKLEVPFREFLCEAFDLLPREDRHKPFVSRKHQPGDIPLGVEIFDERFSDGGGDE